MYFIICLIRDSVISQVIFSHLIKKIQSSAKQTGGATANIPQGPLSLGASAGGFQKSLVPLRGGLSKPGSLKRGSNYS